MNLLYCPGGDGSLRRGPAASSPNRSFNSIHDCVMDNCNFAEYTAYITPRGLQYAGKSSTANGVCQMKRTESDFEKGPTNNHVGHSQHSSERSKCLTEKLS